MKYEEQVNKKIYNFEKVNEKNSHFRFFKYFKSFFFLSFKFFTNDLLSIYFLHSSRENKNPSKTSLPTISLPPANLNQFPRNQQHPLPSEVRRRLTRKIDGQRGGTSKKRLFSLNSFQVWRFVAALGQEKNGPAPGESGRRKYTMEGGT